MRGTHLALLCTLLLCAGCAGQPNPSAAATSSGSSPYVKWLALPTTGVIPQAPKPSPTPPVPIPPGTPVCTAASLEIAYYGGGGAGGHTNYSLLFRNRSTSLCYLRGFPDVTIVDAAGTVMEQAVGRTQRGTFFDNDWVVPVLMTSGTPSVQTVVQMRQSVVGQAWINIEWYDCHNPSAARVLVDLPDEGGRLAADFPVKGSYSAACDGGTPAPSLTRGQFNPTGLENWPPAADPIPASVSITVPSAAKHGSQLTYFVVITNKGHVDYRMTPCPDYVEILGSKQAVANYRLNCKAAGGHIAPGSSVTFEMRLQVPESMPSGMTKIQWALSDFRIAPSFASADVSIS